METSSRPASAAVVTGGTPVGAAVGPAVGPSASASATTASSTTDTADARCRAKLAAASWSDSNPARGAGSDASERSTAASNAVRWSSDREAPVAAPDSVPDSDSAPAKRPRRPEASGVTPPDDLDAEVGREEATDAAAADPVGLEDLGVGTELAARRLDRLLDGDGAEAAQLVALR
jgi:hypothetical protein